MIFLKSELMNKLFKEIGILRCEMEMMNETTRKDELSRKTKDFPRDAELLEKKMKINNTEQILLISIFFYSILLANEDRYLQYIFF